MKIAAFALSFAIWAGCASSSQIYEQNVRIAELNEQVQNLSQQIDYLNGRIDQMSQSMDNLQRSIDATRVVTPSTTTPAKSNSSVQDNTTPKRCTAITAKGTQCSRNAQSGSEFCWQHVGSSDSKTINKSSQPSGSSTIHTGPRGGQYRINSSGKKVYIPKKK